MKQECALVPLCSLCLSLVVIPNDMLVGRCVDVYDVFDPLSQAPLAWFSVLWLRAASPWVGLLHAYVYLPSVDQEVGVCHQDQRVSHDVMCSYC